MTLKPFCCRLTRRQLLTLGGAVLAGELVGPHAVSAQPIQAEPIRIGVVTPTQTPGVAVSASLYEVVGEAARLGALLGGENMSVHPGLNGRRLSVFPASSPTAEAAFRAGQRLVVAEEVHALVGGLGEGQAEILSAVAHEHKIPFFNIGSPNDALRGAACSPYTFHVEASAAMYLDVLVDWYTRLGHNRWFIVHEGSEAGAALHQRARKALRAWQRGAEVVGTAAVVQEQPVYLEELEQARGADANVILLLLEAQDQIAFLSQQESVGLDMAVAPFPDPVTQTRNYHAAIQYRAGTAGSGYRAALWDTTLAAHGAKDLNERFMSRWGKPMDPPAWAAYQAVKLLTEAVIATRTLDSATLIAYLESPAAVFDIQKGPATSFRPWDHQLRQPLYLVEATPGAEWGGGVRLSEQVNIVTLKGEVPASSDPEGSRLRQLDKFGNRATDDSCRLAGARQP